MSNLRIVVAFLLVFACGCQDELYHDLDEHSANQLVTTLQREGIHASKSMDREGFIVRVPPGAAPVAMEVLESHGLPRAPIRGFETFYPGDTLVPTVGEEHAVLQYATSQELRRSLLAIDGVVDARVNLVLPPTPRFEEAAPPSGGRASVVIRWEGNEAPVTAEDVQRVIAGGVPGLASSDVEVLLTPTSPTRESARPALVQVGPITVLQSSLNTARLAFAVLLATVLALGGALSAMFWRERRA